MNKERKAEIAKLIPKVEEIAEAVRELATDEQTQFDELSEKAQEGERGQALSENADRLSTVADELEAMTGTLQEAADA